ncbi:aspartyl protease family protein [Microscilla marina]|uniref:aspartyl protease family protein n=1 Tax=Microscilla marina TaxID=1027 RepID=UPI0006A7085A|nr:aspartyl protease family protein [Microscilla marina]
MSITNYVRIFGLLVVLLSGEFIQAQNYQGFQFKKPHRKKLKRSFTQYNNLIIIPVQINGSKPFNFILDTGVGSTLITDPSVALALDLPMFRKLKVAGVSSQNRLKAHVSNIESIKIFKHIVALKQYVIVLEEDVLNLSGYAGIPIHGIIGYDLFSKFIVKINYDYHKITLYNPERFNYRKKKKHEVLPIRIEAKKPILEAKVWCEQHKQAAPVRLVFDTGAGHALLLYQNSSPGISLPAKTIKAHLGATLSGNLIGKLGKLKQIQLGKYTLPQVVTSFPDSSSYVSMKAFTPRNGNIGLGIIKRFHTIIDYPNKRLIVRPNRHFKDPFDYNRLGMEIIAKAPAYKTFYIAQMREDSPAMKAGLKKGDQILAIDKKPVYNMNISEVYGRLYDHKKKTDKIFIYALRGQELIIATLKVATSL